ncbi:UNVERIFIED_CONTAM: Multiple coagulation factor deficiency protein 2 [Trichonephila clavipes]
MMPSLSLSSKCTGIVQNRMHFAASFDLARLINMIDEKTEVYRLFQQEFVKRKFSGNKLLKPLLLNISLNRPSAKSMQRLTHIKEHLQGVVNQPDVSKMTEEELQFHYFKMHDNDDNNKLDGCELIKSVLHWHVEESNAMGANAPEQGTTKIFQDNELALMIDPILDMDDRNKDGFIDYPEFVNAQKSRGF